MKDEPQYVYNNISSLPTSKIPFSIETRPEEINNRSVFGHFKVDTVIGISRGKHECLLTITERKTKYQIISKISSKTAENVVNKIKSFMKNI